MSHTCQLCDRPAMGPYTGRMRCARHREQIGRIVTSSDIRDARKCLVEGDSLKTTATLLSLMAPDLDLALWNQFGKPLEEASPRRYAPEFVA